MSVTNLNKVRKARAKQQRKARADVNAVAFGRTKADKAHDARQTAKTDAKIDAHKRDR